MTEKTFVPNDDIRSAFSAAMSAMYRTEVPAYGTLMDLVAEVNGEVLSRDPDFAERLAEIDALDGFPRSAMAPFGWGRLRNCR